MKIGIVTFYRVPNYGAMLQAYSLWKYLEKCGHEVVFIQHRRCIASRISLWRCFVSRRLEGVKIKLRNYVRFPMTDFAKDYPQTTYCETIDDVKKFSADCDAYIVGSDQMWNPLWCSSNENLKLVMLDFASECKPRISYAASFGTREWRDDQNAAEAGRLLKKFKAISVREESGVKLVESLSGRNDAKWLLDPTLLQTAAFYREMIKNQGATDEEYRKPYIFNYTLDEWSDGVIESDVLKQVQSVSGVDTVRSDKTPVKGWLSLLSCLIGVNTKVSVVRWLSLIANSEFVVTNSFHGTVFAILFHRPFVSVLLKGRMSCMNERIVSLLGLLGLDNRAVSEAQCDNIKGIKETDIDWNEVDSRLEKLRSRTCSFITEGFNVGL